jgi:hypothetical protein
MTKTIYFAPGLKPVIKFNPNHDEKGQFSSGPGGSSSAVDDLNKWNDAELAKFNSVNDQESYLLDNILSQRMQGFTGKEYYKSVNDYQTLLGYTINEALRDPQISTEQVKYLIAGLDAAIDSAPPLLKDTVVYRGVKGNGLDFFESLKPGNVYTDKGFSSTSLDSSIATKFATSGSMYQGIVLRMKLPAGTKGLYPTSVTGLTSLSSRESEFLLPRNSSFKVLNNQGKVWDVEVVNNA